jgi:2'-5' RNA ligase
MFAIMPPADLAARIHNERLLFSEKYHCVKALKPPVHITVYPPFNNSPDFETKIKEIEKWAKQQEAFPVELRDYNYFKNPGSPVVYIAIVNNPALTHLHDAFLDQLQKYMPVEKHGSYKPHFTIGYRDVPRQLFPHIVSEYSARHFSGSFEVSSIFLWKHDGKNWQIIDEYKFAHN